MAVMSLDWQWYLRLLGRILRIAEVYRRSLGRPGEVIVVPVSRDFAEFRRFPEFFRWGAAVERTQ